MDNDFANPLISRRIMDSVAAGIFTVDLDWRITFFNREAERITGVRSDQALGQYWADIVRASDADEGCALKHSLRTGEPVINRAIYLTDNKNRRVPVSITTAVLRDENEQVIGCVESFRDLSRVEELQKRLQAKYTFEDIIGRSAAMRKVFELLPIVAESDSTTLIEGSSGTGKELVARAIHNLSARRRKPFVAINCGALPDTLLESELFGYKKGAFTGADRDKSGRFALAEGGTIFLDEIADISPAMQTRLLRVLQERVFESLGSVAPVKADVRIVVATNQSLSKLVEHDKFREDLFYRVNVIRIELPALRDRRVDIPLLIDHFITRFNRLKEKNIHGVSPEAMSILMGYDYPGNVRELENIIEHAFVLCAGGVIEPQHLPAWLRGGDARVFISDKLGRMTLDQIEKLAITDAIRRHHGNRHAAARELDIHPSTLFRKIKTHEINLPEEDGRYRSSRSRAIPKR
jgi:PAS domain S-box-containing protein